MAYDGLLLRAQLNEIKKSIINERISKIIQLDNKSLSLVFRKNNTDLILFISINPNFPYITLNSIKPKTNKNPYAFTMLLRKYLESGKIKNINQFDGLSDYNSLERIIEISIVNTIDTGDIKEYKLIIELLGRYANVILTDDKMNIIDLMYKVNNTDTKLRVLRIKDKYSTKELYKKENLINIKYEKFIDALNNSYLLKQLNNETINYYNIFLNSFYGLSKTYIISIINQLNISEYQIINDISSKNLDSNNLKLVYNKINVDINNILNNKYQPTIYYENNQVKDFHILDLSIYDDKIEKFTNVCDMLNKFVELKFGNTINNSKINSLKHIIDKLIDKTLKKISVNEIDIDNSKDYELDKQYADAIQTYGYNNDNIIDGILYCTNLYDNKMLKIKLNKELSIQKNAEYYYNSYNKKKRTIEKSKEQIKILNNEIEYLHNLDDTLEYITDNEDIIQLENELNTNFKIKNATNTSTKKVNKLNKAINILHFKAYDGTDIYVGKNNIQNDYVTFKIADLNDTWLHVKNATGAHVIIKKNYENLDIKILEQAASIAAYYSSLKNETKVAVDYTLRKELKKVKGKPLGFVIYHKNYSINVEPKVMLKEIK